MAIYNSLFTYASFNDAFPNSRFTNDIASLTREPTELFAELNGTLDKNEFAPTHEPVPYVIWAGGCQANGSSHDDCSAACSDPSWIWTSTTALSSCSGASLIAGNNLSDATNQTIVQQAKDLGIYFDNTTSDDGIHPDVSLYLVSCLQSYCASAPCEDACATLNDDSRGDFGYKLQNCYEAMCSTISLAVNPDLGGIGVRKECSYMTRKVD